MNKNYMQVCLGLNPELKTDEEKRFHKSPVKEMQEKEKSKPVQWAITSG